MRKRFACVKAQDSNGCGPAALATVARHYGLYVSTEWLRGRLGTDLQGTSLRNLQESAEELGFSASWGRAKPGVLDSLPLPAIAHFKDTPNGHLVVVHSIDQRRIIIADPAVGVIHASRSKFLERWSGYLLLLAPGPDFRPKGEAHSPVREMFKAALREHRTIGFSLVLAFVFIGFGYVTSLLAQLVLDRVIPKSDNHLLCTLSVAALGFMAIRFAAGVARQIAQAKLGYSTQVSLGLPYTRKVLSLPLEFFDRRSTGDIFARTNDITSISTAISSTLVSVLPDTFFLLLSGLVLLCYSLRLTAVLFSFLPLLVVIVLCFAHPLSRKEREIREQMTEWANRFIEVMQNIKSIKAFCSEEFAYQKTAEVYKRAYETLRMRTVMSDAMGGLCSFVIHSASIALLWVGALLAIRGTLTTGQVIFFYASAGLFLSSVERLPGTISSLQEAIIGFERLHDVSVLESENTSIEEDRVLPPVANGNIEFRNVGFWHRRNTLVLSDINLKISQGEWLAILGETGSGKSTLASMIAGLYSPRQGTILLDGIDVTSLRKESLRKHVAIVFQDARLMRGTIHENIAMGDPSISREQVREAACLASADEFVRGLPRGYDYDVGPFGRLLSSGQRQRIAIARALLRNPAVLILDEATSNLDIHTELKIMAAIRGVRRGRTTLVITHRLSTALLGDRVLVLQSGAAVEHGTHDELLASGGYYHSMWQALALDRNRNEESAVGLQDRAVPIGRASV